MEHLMAVILAAGEGKRMKSVNSKVIHRICGKALIEWVYDAVENSGINNSVVVVGHRADQVRAVLGDKVCYATQDRQLGTGHAVMQAGEYLEGKEGLVFVLAGDVPLISPDTIAETIRQHRQNGNSATVITAELDNPAGYGRIVRNSDGNVVKIVEHRDASAEERKIREVNSGMYCFSISNLLESLKKLKNNNEQGEYYLTDTLEILIKSGLKVGAVRTGDSNEILGINDRVQLEETAEIVRRKINREHMLSGVTIIDRNSTYIDAGVIIGRDTVVYPGTVLEGGTVIGTGCVIGPNSRIVSSNIGNGVEVINSVVLESSIDDNTHVGPFAFLRPGSYIGREVKIGDFVEVKKSRIGDGTKVSHLTYIGDAEIGKNVNLGCGVVVVNYDGKKKNKTIVGDNCFVGCNVNLVSPVEVRDNAYIAAGSTITEEVPENSLAIARCRQVIKEDWVTKKGMSRKKD